MQTLRSYNKRMAKFASPKVKRSRRKFAIGGETSNWDPTYRNAGEEPLGGTSLRNINYADGGLVEEPPPTDLRVGNVEFAPRPLIPETPGEAAKLAGSMMGGAVPRALSLGASGMRAYQNRASIADNARRAANAIGSDLKPIRPPPQSVQDAAATGKAIGDAATFAAKDQLRMRWMQTHPSDVPREARETVPEVPVKRTQSKKEREGLRTNYALGGPVRKGRILDEEGNPLEPEADEFTAGPVPVPGSLGAGYQGSMEGPPRIPDPQALRQMQSPDVAVPPTPAGAAVFDPRDPTAPETIRNRAETGGGGGTYGKVDAATGYTSDAEAGAGARNKMLDYFGLRSGTTRESQVGGAPGVTKYKDASGKTLYANTTDVGGGRVSTYESGPVAKQNADRLTGAIQARLASGAPEDLEMARRLAVTPEHRALIAEQDNLRGLRNRVSLGDPTAVLELQTRAQQGLLKSQSQAQMLNELFKHQLSSQITPYQQADLSLRANQQAVTQARETRAENFAQNNAMIQNQFGDTPEGKAAATRFHQRLADAMPHLKGDLAQLKPEQQNLLFGASKILDLYEADQKPGWVTTLFGAKAPQYNQLLDVMRNAKIQPNWFHGGELVTSYGKLAERNMDAGTWKTITQMVNDAQKSAPIAKK